MAWQKYTLCFRLLSPLHIGYRKVGNMMQTRGYVPGKNLWAALTERLTRDFDDGATSQRYVTIGKAVNKGFRFGYLYLALPRDLRKDVQSVGDLSIHYPWEDSLFDFRFLSSYAGTALNHDRMSAADGLLHEAEFIRPWARPLLRDNQPLSVYLVGYLYVQDSLTGELAGWRMALDRMQLGGERGYGWGRLACNFCLIKAYVKNLQSRSKNIPQSWPMHGPKVETLLGRWSLWSVGSDTTPKAVQKIGIYHQQ